MFFNNIFKTIFFPPKKWTFYIIRFNTRKGTMHVYHRAWEKDPFFRGWLKPHHKSDRDYCILCRNEVAAVVALLKNTLFL